MGKLIWLVAWLGATVWSGLCFLGYFVIGQSGRFIASNADFGGAPEAVEQFSNLSLTLAQVGEWVVIGVWGLGLLGIFVLAKLVTYFLSRADQREALSANPPAPPARL